jgi:hypothetical protein
MAMTIEEIEAACAGTQPVGPPRHPQMAPELTLKETFYPNGFPTDVWTNSAEILDQCRQSWGAFERQFDTEAIRIEIHVLESDSTECPPAPKYRIMMPMMIAVADANNYVVADLADNRTQIVLTSAVLQHRAYLQYFFVDGMAASHIGARYTQGIHAACVALDGRGVLLCGDSGAGKSTLSYACARAGWTYVTDDLSLLRHGETNRMVLGNCHQVRLRPAAKEFFPELEGLEIAPRAAGKPSIAMPAASLAHIARSQTARADFIVFLNRRGEGPPELVAYSKDVARYFMRGEGVHASEEILAQRAKSIDELLEVDVWELRYSDLDWAVERLKMLVQEGR